MFQQPFIHDSCVCVAEQTEEIQHSHIFIILTSPLYWHPQWPVDTTRATETHFSFHHNLNNVCQAHTRLSFISFSFTRRRVASGVTTPREHFAQQSYFLSALFFSSVLNQPPSCTYVHLSSATKGYPCTLLTSFVLASFCHQSLGCFYQPSPPWLTLKLNDRRFFLLHYGTSYFRGSKLYIHDLSNKIRK